MHIDIGAGRLMLGDCLERMAEIPSGSVQMILADLPYATTRNAWDSLIPFEPLWAQYWRVAAPNAAIVLTAQMPFTAILGASQIKYLRYEWIWEKTAATGFMTAGVAPLKAHENVLVFYRNQPTYNPIKTTGHKRITRGRTKTPHGDNYGLSDSEAKPYDSTERYPRSVMTIPKDNRLAAVHPTQKPVALFEYLIRTYTQPGDTVLDNCLGSGTTAIAAERSGRRWIGIERDEGYYNAALARIWTECAA